MPYKYVMKWRNGEQESLSVEAWPKSRNLALPNEIRKPSFIIGSVKGPRAIMLWHLADDIIRKYGSRKKGQIIRVDFPPDDITAISDAYRLGLAAAAIAKMKRETDAETVLRYIIGCTREEIWFWTSKFLGVVDYGLETDRVIQALCLIIPPNIKHNSNSKRETGKILS